jgi:hypothetical protein
VADKLNDQFQSAADKPMAQRINELRPRQKEEIKKLNERRQEQTDKLKAEHEKKRKSAIERVINRILSSKSEFNFDFAGPPPNYEKRRQEAQQQAEKEVANSEALELKDLSDLHEKELERKVEQFEKANRAQTPDLKKEWDKSIQKGGPDRDKGPER